MSATQIWLKSKLKTFFLGYVILKVNQKKKKNISLFQVDQYFAKYLTNQKLLDLQFSDANFRRYVLLQILILAQYLTSDIKFKQ